MPTLIIKIVYFGLVSLIFLALSYVLGRSVLVGALGNDSPLHIANTDWFNQFLPSIPNWFPLHGGGMSIQRSYPIMSYLIVAGMHRISGLDITQAYRLAGFLSIPLTAIAVYLLARGVMRSKTIGLIAGVLFVLSPVSWSWIFEQGYIATTLASVGLPIVILAFIRLIESSHKTDSNIETRLWFVLFAVTLAFVTVTHAVVAAAAIAGIGFYFIFHLLVGEYGHRIKPVIQSIKIA
ncbi:MAG: 6-pyruvoyl-tetrahydropterin synthase-related protein, partial [Anaerolineales bacterium]